MRFCLLLLLSSFVLLGCRREREEEQPPAEQPPVLVNPEVTATAVNSGEDLELTWRSIEGADGYRVYCDGNKIWEGRDTTYTINGSERVCREVQVSAYNSRDEKKATIDLTPKLSTITVVSHDAMGNSWVKLDFNNGTASSLRQSDVDKNAPNVGWFVFFNNSGNPEFRDASATTVGRAKMEVAFTASSSGNLAPDEGNYNIVRETSANAYHFFWADNTSVGYGSMDNYDYFGVIKVTSLTGSGPYNANLAIYIQHKVPGLRWVKF